MIYFILLHFQICYLSTIEKFFFFLIIESDVTGLLGACFNSLVL